MRRLVWRHFALVALVILLFEAAMWTRSFYMWPHRPDPVPWAGILRYLGYNWPRYYIGALPSIAGIAIALLDLRAGAIRVAVTMAALVLGVMVLYDVWGEPALRRAAVEAMHGAPEWPMRSDSTPPRLDDTTGVLQRSVALIRGKVQPSDLQPWPPKSKPNSGLIPITNGATIVRIEAVRTFAELGQFLLPFIDIGLVLGVTAWISRRARFERQRDSRMLRVAAAWIVVLFTEFYIQSWMQGQSFYVSAEGGSLLWLYAVDLPALLLATLGWRAAIRTSRAAAG